MSATKDSTYDGLKYSILPDQLTGTMYVTGFRGRGKSTLAAHSEDPDLIAFYDFDDGKGLSLHKQLKFGLYRDMVGEGTAQYGPVMTSEQVYNFFHKAITDLPSGRFTVLVIDNIDWLERGLAWEVGQRPAAYGVDPAKAKSGSWGGVWPGVNNLVSSYISAIHGKGIRLVIAVAHIKTAWSPSGTPIPNKYKPRGVDRWQQMSALTIALIPGAEPLIPVGIVYKQQLAITSYNRKTRKHETINPLPLRIPVCTFEAIRNYITSPADLSDPKAGEVPTEDELALFGEKFTKEQLTYIILAGQLKLKGLDGSEEPTLPADFPQLAATPVDGQQAQEMLTAGTSPIDIAAHFSKELGVTINVGEVFRAATEYKTKTATNGTTN